MPKVIISKRRYKALLRAEKVARECRYQIAKVGGIQDQVRVGNLVLDWMKMAGKNKFERPV